MIPIATLWASVAFAGHSYWHWSEWSTVLYSPFWHSYSALDMWNYFQTTTYQMEPNTKVTCWPKQPVALLTFNLCIGEVNSAFMNQDYLPNKKLIASMQPPHLPTKHMNPPGYMSNLNEMERYSEYSQRTTHSSYKSSGPSSHHTGSTGHACGPPPPLATVANSYANFWNSVALPLHWL